MKRTLILITALIALVAFATTANATITVFEIQPGLAGDFNYFNTDFNLQFQVLDTNAAATYVDYNVNIYYSPAKGQQTIVIIEDLNLGNKNENTLYCSAAIGTTATSCTYPFPSVSGVLDGNYYIDVNVVAYYNTGAGAGLKTAHLYDQSMDSNVSFSIDKVGPTVSITSGTTEKDPTYSLTYTATDTNASAVKYWVKAGGDKDVTSDWTDNTTDTSYDFTVGSWIELPTSQTYYVKAKDAADNNGGIAEVTVSFEAVGGSGGAHCGDSRCEGVETAATCPADCSAVCGDGACTHTESVETCPEDCLSACGDGVCSAGAGETCETCAEDCDLCPAGVETILRKSITKKPTGAEIAAILTNAGASQNAIDKASAAVAKTTVSREIRVEKITDSLGNISYKTTMTIMVSNPGKKKLQNIKIVENLPKAIISVLKKEDIESNYEFEIIRSDPIIQFTVNELEQGESTALIYSIVKQVKEADLAGWVAPITTEAEEAVAAECTSNADCDDKNPCTTDKCIGQKCSVVTAADGTECGFAKQCSAGQCVERGIVIAGTPTGIDPFALVTIIIVLVVVVYAAYSYFGKKEESSL